MKLKAYGKFIDSTPIKNILVQGEKNADIISFEIDRYYNNIDISELVFIMKGINSENQLAEQNLIKKIEKNIIILKWTVDAQFTAKAGVLNLEIRGVTNSETDSDLNTVIKYTIPSVNVISSSVDNLPSVDVISNTLDSIHAAAAEVQEIYENTCNVSVKAPYISNGVWWIYNIEQSAYENSGVSAYDTSKIISSDVSAVSSINVTLANNIEFRYINGTVSNISISAGSNIDDYNFISSVVFKSGSTSPTLNISFDFDYIGDILIVSANKQYCLIFFNDGFGIKCAWYEV